MPTSLDVATHLDGLRQALLAFVRYAGQAGLKAPVPTTPEWNVRRLVAHQGMVHRWAAGQLRGEQVDPAQAEREGQTSADPLAWLEDGAIELAGTIAQVAEDVDALVFLHDAPPARAFWARRQCHETTIHAVDALAAALGRMPVAAETWIPEALALDGIDELLRGFVTRSKSGLRSAEPLVVAVCPEGAGAGADRAWRVQVSEEPAVTEVVAGGHAACDGADLHLSGGAVALYLTLWNRSTDVVPEGGSLDLWRERSAIRWA